MRPGPVRFGLGQGHRRTSGHARLRGPLTGPRRSVRRRSRPPTPAPPTIPEDRALADLGHHLDEPTKRSEAVQRVDGREHADDAVAFDDDGAAVAVLGHVRGHAREQLVGVADIGRGPHDLLDPLRPKRHACRLGAYDVALAEHADKALALDDGQVPNVVVGEADNGVAGLALADSETPDIVLLDIRMPKMDGIELAQHLARLPQPPAVIFATAYDAYAMQAFDLNAVDYLLKPVRAQRLAAALSKARVPVSYTHLTLPTSDLV